MVKTVTFKVGMTCSGCQNAVTRTLNKVDGVKEVKANLETKIVEVVVEDAVPPATLESALRTWAATSKKSVELVA
eukprot:scaffold6384_cov176-Ochromonas_danica.AAC.5